MTRLETLKAAAKVAYAKASEAEYIAAYEAEQKKTQEENSDDDES